MLNRSSLISGFQLEVNIMCCLIRPKLNQSLLIRLCFFWFLFFFPQIGKVALLLGVSEEAVMISEWGFCYIMKWKTILSGKAWSAAVWQAAYLELVWFSCRVFQTNIMLGEMVNLSLFFLFPLCFLISYFFEDCVFLKISLIRQLYLNFFWWVFSVVLEEFIGFGGRWKPGDRDCFSSSWGLEIL